MKKLQVLTQATFKLVPEWVEWIAVDDDGMACGFSHEPRCRRGVYVRDVRIPINDYMILEDDYDVSVRLLRREVV